MPTPARRRGFCANLAIVLPMLCVNGCRTGGNGVGMTSALHDSVLTRARPPTLPAPGGQGALAPWGGTDPGQWRAEAVLANAASSALNQAWAEDDVADVSLAMPLRLFPSDFFPYGDGQSNANPSFEGWKTKRPPLIAVLLRRADGSVRVTFHFDADWHADQKGYHQVEVRYQAPAGTMAQVILDGHVESGALVATWDDPPASLGWTTTTGQGVALVRPAPQFDDFFPVTFSIPVRTVPELIGSVKAQLATGKPQEFRNFLDRTLIPDRQKLRLTDEDKNLLKSLRSLDAHTITLAPGTPEYSARQVLLADVKQRIDELVNLHRIDNPGISQAALDALKAKYEAMATDGKPSVLKKALFLADFEPIYNVSRAELPYMPLNIHGDFPTSGIHITTGVGMGWTWVADNDSPFKIMYTCFERRQPTAEGAVNLGLPADERQKFGRTVASGGGWHRIGDNQETIINSLEEGPLVVASGFSTPTERIGLSPPPGSNYAYGLSDVAVVRWLEPNEAFVTVRYGDKGDWPEGRKSNYHWYFFGQETEVCTEEWVHLFGDPNTPNFLAP